MRQHSTFDNGDVTSSVFQVGHMTSLAAPTPVAKLTTFPGSGTTRSVTTMDVTTAVLQGQKTTFSTLYNFDNISISSAAFVGQWWHSSVRNGTTRNVGKRGARKAFGNTN